MSLPTITENSEISRLAERKFSVLLPGKWTMSSPKEGDDYGIDVTLSITAGDHPTGRLAHVQLKGTRAKSAGARTFRVKESTLSYLRSHADVAVLVRVQVDEDLYWIVHVYDVRTYDVPDSEGYVRIALDEQDEVAATAIADRIDCQSYRKYVQSAHGAPFAIRVTPPSLTMVLNMKYSKRVPRALSFVADTSSPDATHQMWLSVPPDPGRASTIRDLASPHSTELKGQSPGHLIVALADFLARMGAGHLASGVVMGSPDLITQDAMDTLDRAVQQSNLRDMCVRFAADNELSSFILASIATGAHWAGEWAVNFIICGRYVASLEDIEAIFNCLPSSRHLAFQLLRTKLYNQCGHVEAAREQLKGISVPAEGDPVELFELGDVAQIFRLSTRFNGRPGGLRRSFLVERAARRGRGRSAHSNRGTVVVPRPTPKPKVCCAHHDATPFPVGSGRDPRARCRV